MEWRFNGSIPVYQQIMEQLRDAVLSGTYPAGSRIPSVRELAGDARVNPNTMQRALSELEHEGLLVCHGTLGRCVTEDSAVLDQLRNRAVEQAIRTSARQFRTLGLTMRQAADRLLELENKEEE